MWHFAIYYGTGSTWYGNTQGPRINELDGYGSATTPVPEPSTMLLLSSGLIGLWGLRRKFKKETGNS